MQSRVLARLNMGSNDPLAGYADEYVNEALHYIETASPDGWPWMRRTVTLSATASTSSYTFAALGNLVSSGTLVSKVLGAKVLRSTVYEPLRLMGADEAAQLYPTTTTGAPEAWFAEGQNFYLYPTPDTTYSVVIRVLIQEQDLSISTATPAIPAVFHPAVVEAATLLFYESLQDVQRAEKARATVDDWIRKMKTYGREYTGGVKVRVRDWLA